MSFLLISSSHVSHSPFSYFAPPPHFRHAIITGHIYCFRHYFAMLIYTFYAFDTLAEMLLPPLMIAAIRYAATLIDADTPLLPMPLRL